MIPKKTARGPPPSLGSARAPALVRDSLGKLRKSYFAYARLYRIAGRAGGESVRGPSLVRAGSWQLQVLSAAVLAISAFAPSLVRAGCGQR